MEPETAPAPAGQPGLPHVPTRVPGLDAVLGGGLLAGDAYLVVGDPGTGKTTLGNHLAFAHAAAGGTALIATLATETHDRMLAHMAGFAFADRSLVGVRLHYLSLLRALEAGGVEGVLEAVRQVVREHRASLLVVDGAAAERIAGSEYGGFLRGLQVQTALLGCTTVLLSAAGVGETRAATAADGVVALANERVGSRGVRWLEVAKLRGAAHLHGRHQFAIGPAGVAVFPRLEAALADTEPPPKGVHPDRAGFGVERLDAMLGGGLPRASTTMLLGTPGAGKTVFGLHFAAEGARRGEPVLIAGFHEPGPTLVETAAGVGLDLAPAVATDQVRVLWRAPLERSPDAWAWELLAAVAAQRSSRVVVDAFTDAGRLFAVPERQVPFLQALSNELRARAATVLFVVEQDAYVGPELVPPLTAVSATMDNGILLRQTELGSRLHHLVSVLKMRQSPFDHAIRSFAIGQTGIAIGEPFEHAAGLLVGGAAPAGEPG
jgi:circadian clock protein KaiC